MGRDLNLNAALLFIFKLIQLSIDGVDRVDRKRVFLFIVWDSSPTWYLGTTNSTSMHPISFPLNSPLLQSDKFTDCQGAIIFCFKFYWGYYFSLISIPLWVYLRSRSWHILLLSTLKCVPHVGVITLLSWYFRFAIQIKKYDECHIMQ